MKVWADVSHIPLMPFSSINAYLADGILFDGGTRQSRRTLLRKLKGRDVTAHALTHAHPDHQGASHAICEALGIPLFVGAGDAGAMAGTESMSIPANHITRLLDVVWAGPPHPVDRRLEEGDFVGRFVVIDTPGHSDGHVVYWDERDGVLILGDVLRNISFVTLRPGLHEPPLVFTPDSPRNRESARKLIGLRPRLVLFGHGPPLRDPDRFDTFLRSLPD
jgi:glyoxylase-like metal-dependent hydrolase (beta-lactamase superfamily II)